MPCGTSRLVRTSPATRSARNQLRRYVRTTLTPGTYRATADHTPDGWVDADDGVRPDRSWPSSASGLSSARQRLLLQRGVFLGGDGAAVEHLLGPRDLVGRAAGTVAGDRADVVVHVGLGALGILALAVLHRPALGNQI